MKYLFFILLLITSINLTAQDENDTNDVGSLRIDILAPGIGGEIQISPLHTIAGSVNLGFSFEFSANSNGQRSSYFIIAPSANIQYRYYFNRANRIAKGKSVYNNSGLFIGGHLQYNANEIYKNNNIININDGFQIGPIFGVQRTFNNNLQLGVSLGVGYSQYSSNDIGLASIGAFNFSYVIFPKRNR